MKTKILSLLLLTVICALSISFVTAATFTMTTTQPADLTKNSTQTSFTITPNGLSTDHANIVVTIPTNFSDGSNTITLNPPYTYNFQNVAFGTTTTPIVIGYTGSFPSNFFIGRITANANVTITNVSNSADSLSQLVPISLVNDFCSNGEQSTNLSISSVEIDNADGDNTDWTPLNSITVKVDVSNDGDSKVSGVETELGIYDASGRNVVSSLDNLANKKIKLGTINDGSSKTATYKFNVPINFKEEDHRLVVKAYSTSKGQTNLCVSTSSDLDGTYYQSVTSSRETDENKQIILHNIVTSPTDSAQCGDVVQITGEVANIGDTDYTDQVKVTMFNKELGINQEQVLKEDFNQGDTSSVNFDFTVPQNATEKTYTLDFRTYYDYDTTDQTYGLSSSDTFTQTVKVLGNCAASNSTTTTTTTITPPQITATPDTETPDAIAGKQFIVDATIKNPGNTDQTYTLSVLDNSAWSDVQSIEPKTVTVPAGSSRDASIVLNINNNVAGDNSFLIRTTYGPNNDQAQQRVSLTVIKQSASNQAFSQYFQANWLIFLIILINVILIIAIIIVIRRMMRPRPSM